MIGFEQVSDEMREDGLKILKRAYSTKKAYKEAVKAFSNGANICAAYSDDDPWTTCAISINGTVVALGSAKRLTYAKSCDSPNVMRGREIAFARAVRNLAK